MGKAAKATTPITMDFEIAEDRSCELHDYTVSFVTIRQDNDLAPILANLPSGRCECPHWGVVTKGQATATYPDRSETFEAGDAFYMPPGHSMAAVARHRVHPVQPHRPPRRDRRRDRQGAAAGLSDRPLRLSEGSSVVQLRRARRSATVGSHAQR
jgi:hypothetical protein